MGASYRRKSVTFQFLFKVTRLLFIEPRLLFQVKRFLFKVTRFLFKETGFLKSDPDKSCCVLCTISDESIYQNWFISKEAPYITLTIIRPPLPQAWSMETNSMYNVWTMDGSDVWTLFQYFSDQSDELGLEIYTIYIYLSLPQFRDGNIRKKYLCFANLFFTVFVTLKETHYFLHALLILISSIIEIKCWFKNDPYDFIWVIKKNTTLWF